MGHRHALRRLRDLPGTVPRLILPERKRFAPVLALLFLFAQPAISEADHPCDANVGYGPLNLREQSPFSMIHLGLTPSAPSALRGGEWEAQLQTAWVNMFGCTDQHLLIDQETLQVTPRLSYGLTSCLQIGVETPLLLRGGGTMDALIERFHKIFGISFFFSLTIGSGSRT